MGSSYTTTCICISSLNNPWIICGGNYNNNYSDGTTINFPYEMQDKNYTIISDYIRDDTTYETGADIVTRKYNRTTTGFKTRLTAATNIDQTYGNSRPWCWTVFGYIKS
ncbi:hypothetical protein J6W34_00220 [bacterium]|nr:hypothetical protein [bacterium]